MNKLRVVLADDHAVVREGLKVLINAEADMEVIGEATEGERACQLAAELAPDVVVMDVSMPGTGGAAATKRISRDCPNVRVLALTAHEVPEYLRQLIEAGAAGYVLKRAAANELVVAIREVAGGGVYLDPKLGGQIAQLIKPASPSAGALDELTEREIEVVKLLARGHINREIAQQLDLSIKTIEVHKSRAMEKLGLRSRAALVDYALRQGWLQVS